MKKVILFLTCALFLSGCGDSGSQKWRLDNPNLTSEEIGILKKAIESRDNIKRNNSWESLNGEEWSSILIYFPSERKKCLKAKGFVKFDGSNWAKLLSEEPRFEKDCEENRGWEMILPNDWVELLKKQPSYISKAKQLNALKKFSAENWRNVILSKEPVLLQECDILNGWETLKSNDWITLISLDKKYVDLAKKKNVFSKFDNATWIKSILENPALSSVAEKEGVFEKFSPDEWNILLIPNPEFAAVFHRAKALEKYSKIDLVRLYVLQPKLRNEIFALNKIDLDFAKQIEILHSRFANRGLLNAEEITVLSSIFPEILYSLSEQSFSRYSIEDWKIALAKSPLLFKKISEKYAYLVPWKSFNLGDWCEILDTNPSLFVIFKNNVKTLSVKDITSVMIGADFKGYNSLDTLDIWSQFTSEQYVGILSEYAKLEHEPRSYDGKFIISKAKENGVFTKLTEEQWKILLKDINEREDETFLLLIKEYLSLEKQYPVITRKFTDFGNYVVISRFNLWNKLNHPSQWNEVIFNVAKSKPYALSGVLRKLTSSNAIEIFEESDYFRLITSCADVIDSQFVSVDYFKDLSLWNKIPKKTWSLYFCVRKSNPFYIEKSGVKNWGKTETINLIKTYEREGSIGNCSPEESFAKIVNVNSLDLQEAWNAILKNAYLLYYYKRKSEFSLDNLFYLYRYRNSFYENAASVNVLLKGLSEEDRKLLDSIFYHLAQKRSLLGGFNHLKIAKSQIRITCTKCKKKYDDLRWRPPDSQNCIHDWSFSIGAPPKNPYLNPYRKQSNKK